MLECVPNFSEGRDPAIVDAIAQAMTGVDGVVGLRSELDHDHHRAVITIAGPADAVAEAAFRGARAAVERIDLRRHAGVHKRMGALDVCPFVPLAGSTMAAAIRTARAVGERIATQLDVPVFLYAEACSREDRRKLGNVRNLQFEGLRDLLGRDPDYAPDFGPARVHESAGATAVGARRFLVAYNINLQSDDVQLAKAISKTVREQGGGLPGVQAMGFFLAGRRLAQVSMNLLDFERTSIRTVYDRVAELAARHGVEIAESELIGLAPAAALDGELARHIRLPDFDPARQIVEARLAALGAGGPPAG